MAMNNVIEKQIYGSEKSKRIISLWIRGIE